MHKLLLLAIVGVIQLMASCHQETSQRQKETTRNAVSQTQSELDYHFDKPSPHGTYRVKVEITTGPKKGTRDYTELGQYELSKGHEVLYSYKWEESDQYEPSFRELKPVIEWTSDAILRLGKQQSDQPFYDEIGVANHTGETIRYMSVGYGESELFWLFDILPDGEVSLSANPGFKPDGTSNFSVGYGGTTQSGKKFEGVVEGKQRESAADGPLRFQIAINKKDLR